MEIKGKTTYSRFKIAYHIVWVTKYRKKLLKGKIVESLKKIFHQTAREKGWKILALEVMPDHVHVFLSARPQIAPSDIVKLLKGISARRLLMKHPELSTRRGRSKLWSPSYYIGTAGDVSAETIKKYIEECQDA